MDKISMMKLSLTGKAAYISLGKALTSVSSLAAGAILSRYLTKDAYGTYRQLWLAYNTICPLLVLGIPTSVNYFIPQLQHRDRKLFNLQTFAILTFGGAILTSIFFWGGPLIAELFHNPALRQMTNVFSLIPILTLPTLYYQNLFICLDKPILVAVLSAGLALGRLTAVSAPVITGHGLTEVLFGLVIFSVIQFFIVAFFIFRPFGLYVGDWNPGLLVKQIRYAFPIGIASIVGTLTKQLDKIVISLFFSASQYAIYTNGAVEIPLIGIITTSVSAVLMPEFVKLNVSGNSDHLIQLWHRAIRKVALIILPVMIFLLIYAPESLTVLFSAKYVESSSVFRVYLLALPNRVTTFGTVLLSLGLSSLVLRYSAYALVLNLLLNYLLVKAVGFIGPAVGTIVAIYFVNYLQLRKIASLMGKTFYMIFPWRTLGVIIVVALVAGAVSIWPKIFFNNLAAPLLLLYGGVTYAAVFTFAAIQNGVLKKEDLVGLLRRAGI